MFYKKYHVPFCQSQAIDKKGHECFFTKKLRCVFCPKRLRFERRTLKFNFKR